MPPRSRKPGRVAIVAGLRSPFAKSWSTLADVDPIQLSTQVAREVLFQADVAPEDLDHIVWGTVVCVTHAPNVGREVALDLGLYRTPAFTVSRACASGFEAVASAARLILTGEAETVLAGGVDVTSAAPVPHKKEVIDQLQALQKQKGFAAVSTLAHVNPLDLVPTPPTVSERYTGKTMGAHAEEMAVHFDISREAQDAYALASHRKAAQAIESGEAARQISATLAPRGYVREDNLIRRDMAADKLASLKPVFSRPHGTITAASSSALTDGASSVLLMSEAKVKELGITPLGWLRSWHFPAIDPRENMLLGNVYSMPFALEKAGLTMADIDLFEVHEAFAAQVLCNLKCLADDAWCADKLGLARAPGAIPEDRLNIWGGSLAYGHPFAATGGRLLINVLHALQATGGSLGLATACAAGGLGAAMIVERAA
jgi:acetyl-CoA acyltransferase